MMRGLGGGGEMPWGLWKGSCSCFGGEWGNTTNEWICLVLEVLLIQHISFLLLVVFQKAEIQ